jgi:hypothetical protein
MFNQTIEHEPADCETLNLEPAFRHNHNRQEYVRIGILPKDAAGENGTISFELVQFGTDYQCKMLQACLTGAEIDLVIAGLQAVKERMQAVTV